MAREGDTGDAACEAAWAREAAEGRRESFGHLVRRHEAGLQRYIAALVGSREEAEEIAQEALLRAWSRIDRYDPRWRFSTWLYTLAERLCISRRRSRGKEPREVGGEFGLAAPATDEDPAATAAARDEGRALWETAGRALRPEERSALWLRYGEDLSMEEIGAILGRPTVTVRVLLFRARGRLATALEEEGVVPPGSAENAGHAPSGPRPALASESPGGI
jgi:RNA polymerase sigma-70 factor (ECF subfamily)